MTADTGEFTRNWSKGTFVVNTPKTQLAMGALKGETIRTADAAFEITTPHGLAALSSLDDRPLRQSRHILVTTAARVASVAVPKRRLKNISRATGAGWTPSTWSPGAGPA